MELSYQTLGFTHQAREAVRKAYISLRNASPLAAGRFLCPVAMATESAAVVAQAQSLGTRVEAWGLRKKESGFGLEYCLMKETQFVTEKWNVEGKVLLLGRLSLDG